MWSFLFYFALKKNWFLIVFCEQNEPPPLLLVWSPHQDAVEQVWLWSRPTHTHTHTHNEEIITPTKQNPMLSFFSPSGNLELKVFCPVHICFYQCLPWSTKPVQLLVCVWGDQTHLQYLYGHFPPEALCFVLAPRGATGAMTTLQVCCHIVYPTYNHSRCRST